MGVLDSDREKLEHWISSNHSESCMFRTRTGKCMWLERYQSSSWETDLEILNMIAQSGTLRLTESEMLQCVKTNYYYEMKKYNDETWQSFDEHSTRISYDCLRRERKKVAGAVSPCGVISRSFEPEFTFNDEREWSFEDCFEES